jgi:hypothetical protein
MQLLVWNGDKDKYNNPSRTCELTISRNPFRTPPGRRPPAVAPRKSWREGAL